MFGVLACFQATVFAADATKPVAKLPAANARTVWPVFRGDAIANGVATSTLADELDVAWKFAGKGHGFEATVAIADGAGVCPLSRRRSVRSGPRRRQRKVALPHRVGLQRAGRRARWPRVYAGDADGRF